MKANLVLLFFLMLGVAAAQQTNSVSNAANNKMFSELKAKAENGDLSAQFSLGDLYLTGKGVPQDFVEAAKWYQKAAEQGDAICQYNFGFSLEKGKGVPQNYNEAIKWFRKSAEQGCEVAQLELYRIYFYGDGVETNHSEAVKWLCKVAEHGNAIAQYNLGVCYRDGEGLAKDEMQAVNWFRKAADQNDVRAQYNLGCCYRDGAGVAKDEVQTVNWFRKAANQNDASAQCNLGCCFGNGDGVPINYIEAYKWESLAAAQGIEIARNYLSFYEMRMTSEQIAEAQSRAAAFVPHQETENSSSDNSVSSDKPRFSGTGFFITNDGYLISNYHVVKDAAKVRLLTGAGLIDATVVKVDAANDLALLKAVGWFAPLPIAASRTVKLGGTVATVGFPDIGLQGFAPKLAKGEIASLAGAGDDPRYFQISLPVQHGNSGGALVDVHGNVVGIVAARLGVEIGKAVTSDELPENVNYAVKSSLLLSFLESVPEVDAKIKDPNTKDESFEEVVKSAQDAAVLVLVY